MSGEWEEIQQRTFTKWVNAHLRKRGLKINDILADFKDGVCLINLYEIISGESLGKFNSTPKFQIHEIQNLSIVVAEINKFVSSVGIKVKYGAEDVNKGKKREILGLIWCLIHKFEIQDINEEELSAREGLLLWCKKKTAGYKNVKVNDFNNSWKSGLAFCALIHKHRPDLIDFDSLDPNAYKKNLQTAFDIAENELDIPCLLDVNDMVDFKPDDKSVMTYVAYYWKKFASSNKTQKSAKKIGKVAKNQRDNFNMIHDYEKRAKALLGWIDEKDKQFQQPEIKKFGRNMKEVMSYNTSLKEFKIKEKPPQAKEMGSLEILLVNIRSKQKTELVPIYTPPKELSSETIASEWEKLDKDLIEYEKVLRAAITRMKKLEALLARYNSQSDSILEWHKNKEGFLNEQVDNKLPISTCRIKISMLEAHDLEQKNVENTQEQVLKVGEQVIEGDHSESDNVKEKNINLKTTNADSIEKSKEKMKKLKDILEFKLKIEKLCLDFAEKGDSINQLMGADLLELSEPINCSTVEDVDNALMYLDKMEKEHQERKPTLEECQKIYDEVKEFENPEIFSSATLKELKDKYDEETKKIDERRKNLGLEKKRIFDEIEEAKKRREQAIEENKKIISDYEQRAKELLLWIDNKEKEFDNPDIMNMGKNIKEVEDTEDKYQDYKKGEKQDKIKEKNDLEVVLINLKSKQRSEDLEVYEVPEDLSGNKINDNWKNMQDKEGVYDDTIQKALKRMKDLERELARFRSLSEKVISWHTEKEKFVKEEINEKEPLPVLRAKINILASFSNELKAINLTQEKANDVGNKVIEGGHSSSDEVKQTIEKMKQLAEASNNGEKEKAQKLDEVVKKMEALEQKCIELSTKSDKLNSQYSNTNSHLSEPISYETSDEVKEFIEELKGVEDIHGSMRKEALDEITNLEKQIKEGGGDPTVYSNHTGEQLTKKHQDIQTKIGQKKEALNKELDLALKNEELLKEVNTKSKEYMQFSDSVLKQIKEEEKGTPAETLESLKKIGENGINDSSKHIEVLKVLFDKVEQQDISERTDHTINDLVNIHELIGDTFQKRSANLEEAILAEKLSSVSKEQLQDFYDTFKHFDKNKTGKLDKNSFKAACAAAGEDIPEKDLDNTFKKYDSDNDGFIQFEEFITFMSSVVKEGTGYEDIVESFKEIAGGKDYITENQLRANLENDEVDYLISIMPKKNDGYDYQQYAKTVYGK